MWAPEMHQDEATMATKAGSIKNPALEWLKKCTTAPWCSTASRMARPAGARDSVEELEELRSRRRSYAEEALSV